MIIERRGFLKGVFSLLAAPAVVRVENIMPVRLFNPYFTRILIVYDIMTDSFKIRVDKAQVRLMLPDPRHGIEILSMNDAYKFIPKKVIDDMQPKPGQQLYVAAAFDRHKLYGS